MIESTEEQPKQTLRKKMAGFLPNVGELTRQLDERFGKLIEKLDEMLQEQKVTNDLLRQRNGQ